MGAEIEGLERVAEATQTRVSEGREIPLESKRAALNLARAKQRAEAYAADEEYAESTLVIVLQLERLAETPPMLSKYRRSTK